MIPDEHRALIEARRLALQAARREPDAAARAALVQAANEVGRVLEQMGVEDEAGEPTATIGGALEGLAIDDD